MLREPPALDSTEALSELVCEGFALDQNLEDWSADITNPKYQYTSMPALDCSSPNLPPHLLANRSIDIYSSGSMACLWNLWRCTRIRLLQCLRSCMDRQATLSSIPPNPSSLPPLPPPHGRISQPHGQTPRPLQRHLRQRAVLAERDRNGREIAATASEGAGGGFCFCGRCG